MQQRKAPFRPRDDRISQTYNDGLVEVYAAEDQAKPGYQPRPGLVLKGVLSFETQRLGVTRLYTARQAQAEIEKVIRVPKTPSFTVMIQDRAKIMGQSGVTYRIDSTQDTTDVYPASVDLALVRISQGLEGTT